MRETYAEVVYVATRRSAARTTEVVRLKEHVSERIQLFAKVSTTVYQIYLLYTVSCAVVRSLVGRPPSSRLLTPYGG